MKERPKQSPPVGFGSKSPNSEYGAPDLDSGTIRRAVALIRAVYDSIGGGAGGKLHVVIDDWNLEAHHLEYAIDNYELNDAEDACARHLLSMSKT